jgi:type II secretory pathway component PulM
MLEQASEVDSLGHRPVLAVLDSTSLKSSILDSASRHQLSAAITSLDVLKSNGVHIACDMISFALLISWLHELEQEQHIRADSISITALPKSGMVKISATLSNGIVQ